jgi:Holliday junction resolvase RusA-like endonuclease
MGSTAGTYKVQLSVPQLGVSDTISVTVRPGAPFRILFASLDTAVYTAVSYTLGARAVDFWGNAAAEPVSVVSSKSTVGQYNAQDGSVHALATGRAYLIATVGALRDSSGISVVPPGRLVSFVDGGPPAGFYIFNTDGTQYRGFVSSNTSSLPRAQYFLPSGDGLVYYDIPLGLTSDSVSLFLADTLGNAHRLVGRWQTRRLPSRSITAAMTLTGFIAQTILRFAIQIVSQSRAWCRSDASLAMIWSTSLLLFPYVDKTFTISREGIDGQITAHRSAGAKAALNLSAATEKVRLAILKVLLFEFVVPGPPVSIQAHRATPKRRYREKVSAAADSVWDRDRPLIATPVAATITHFFEGAPADLDNIAKLILDGIKRHVLTDDKLVSDLVLQRRPITGPYVITAPSPRLMVALGTEREFVHIAVASPPINAELRPYDYP